MAAVRKLAIAGLAGKAVIQNQRLGDHLSEEEPLEIQGSNGIFTNLERNEDLPFTIDQALQNAMRGQNFRSIFTTNDIQLNNIRPLNGILHREEEQEISSFRSTLLNQIQQLHNEYNGNQEGMQRNLRSDSM